jgi:PPOX class probable F420-dependent enzyme
MDVDTALEFARSHRQTVLTTVRDNGLPQLSNVIYTLDDEGVFRISITATRAKYKNLQKRPWAALHVSAEDFWSYVVLEGDAELGPVATDPDDQAVEELVDLYRALAGEHPDWDDYRRAMVEEQRSVLRVRPTRAYGMLRLPKASGT